MDIGIVSSGGCDFVVVIVLGDAIVDKVNQTGILEYIVVVINALNPFVGDILFQISTDVKSGRYVWLIDDIGQVLVVGNEGFECGEVGEEPILIHQLKDIDIRNFDEGESKEEITLGGSGRGEVEVIDESLVLIKEVDKEGVLVDDWEGLCLELEDKVDNIEIVAIVEIIIEDVVVVVLGNESIEGRVCVKEGQDLGIGADAASGTGDGKGSVQVLGDASRVEGVGGGAKGGS